MINYAGEINKDKEIADELTKAGIDVQYIPQLADYMKTEVKTSVIGTLYGWIFKRAWTYWIAEGPGIPPTYADKLHKEYGKEVRVDGHAGCPSPKEWFKGFAVGHYHIDTQEGLKALADTIKKIIKDNG